KGAFGHMLGAGPVADLLMALRALSEKKVPPSPGAGPGAALSFPEAPEGLKGSPAALILSQGMAGECSALVVRAASAA
ncbi:MAG: hypothetical protein O2807_09515, partial [bacterium]|nr:hypothetical protein [bacterium]